MAQWLDGVERLRLSRVLPYVRGRLLDIGCGYNNLTRMYQSGIGVDVYPWNNIHVLIDEHPSLPFADASFDTVTIIAALNHIIERQKILEEIWRVLRDDGRLIVTMINPLVGFIAHFVFTQDEKVRGGFKAEERKGLWNGETKRLLENAGFELTKIEKFEMGLNRVYLAQKRR